MNEKLRIIACLRKAVFLFFICLLTACGSKKNAPPEVTTNPNVEIEKTKPSVTTDEIMGKFKPTEHDNFVVIAARYADQSGLYLRKETYDAFQKMSAKAEHDGVKLIIRSATRNFYRQKEIWEGKWTGSRLVDDGENLAKTTPDPVARALKILRWSSMPGSSRHHWGTDIDLNAFNNSYFESGKGKKEYDWLVANAADFGFCQPYTQKGATRPNGYNEEKWHWSYMPLANEYISIAKSNMSNTDITGFLGSETAGEIDIKQNYILGVAPCKH